MPPGSKGHDATVLGLLGITLNLLAAACDGLAALFPDKRWLLWALVILFASAALMSALRALSMREGRAEPAGASKNLRRWLMVSAGIAAFILIVGGLTVIRAVILPAQLPVPIRREPARQITAPPTVEAKPLGKPQAQAPVQMSPPPVVPRSYQIVTISRDEIQQQLDAVPPLQRDDAAKHYLGLQVTWGGTYVGAFRSGNRINLLLACGKWGFFDTVAKVVETPGLSLLKSGTKIAVRGTISAASVVRVDLDPAAVVPPE
jgi:hypothetical protein